jgi:signal transduction histidine kinase/ActR/RegA family two-component response regulator
MTTSHGFGVVFDRSPNAYMVLDRRLCYVAANEAYLRVTASRLEDLIGRYVFDLFPNDPEDPSNDSARLIRESFERVLASRSPDAIALIRYRVPQRSEDGRVVVEERLWSAVHTPLPDERGEVAFILQHTVEVTELERLRQTARAASSAEEGGPLTLAGGVLGRAELVQEANRTLDAERQHLRRLFEQAPGFVAFLRGPSHVFELANSAYFKVVGHRDILGKPIREALPELEGQGFYELLDNVFTTGEPFVGRGVGLFLQQQPGAPPEKVFVDFVYQPIVDAAGEISGIFVQGHDITHEKRLAAEREELAERERIARAEAERASHLKDEFLATVSHELRTPLNAMLGWVRLLRLGQVPPDKQASALETVERNARVQSQVIDDLLDVSRIMSGQLRVKRARVRVADVIKAALDGVRPAAEARGVALDEALDADATVSGDEDRLRQIVWNLASNAVKFSAANSRVEVRAGQRGPNVEISVTDAGAGIAPEFLPHVFELFRQADGSTTRSHGGLGLGLSIVKHLVELHGGAVTAESEGLGRGARFTVTLPSIAPERAEPAGKKSLAGAKAAPRDAAPQTSLKGLRVLVIDDERDAREMVRAILEARGALVETAVSAEAGFAAFRRSRPDVVLSDIAMPGGDGYSLIRRIRALSPEDGCRVPAIALTAQARAADRTRVLMAGFRAHVPKPVEPLELVAVLASIVPSAAPAEV